MASLFSVLQRGFGAMVRGGTEIVASYGVGSLVNASTAPARGMNTTGPGVPPPPVGDGIARTREVVPYQNQFPNTQWDVETRFAVLRGVARYFAPAAASISTRVRQVRNSTLTVTMRDPKAPKDTAAIRAVENFLLHPDFDNCYSLKQWLSFGERDVQEVGGFSFVIRRDRIGRVCGLKALDFGTIRRETGAHGEVPKEPEVAFSQVLFGEVVANFFSDQLGYVYPDPVSNELYPRSNTDDAFSVLVNAVLDQIAEIDLRKHNGNLTVFLTGPEGANGEALTKIAAGLRREVNRRMAPGDGVVNIVPVPNGSEVTPLPGFVFDLGREELKRRDVRACYGLSPTPFVSDNSRTTAEEQGDDENNGLVDRLGWWSDVLTDIATRLLGYPHVVVHLVRDVERDEVAHATAQRTRIEAGLTDPDEERFDDGRDDAPHLQELWLAKQRAAAAPPSTPGQIPTMPTPAEPAAVAPPPAPPAGGEITFNELTLALERLKAIGDADMVNAVRATMASKLGIPAPPEITVVSAVAEEIAVEKATQATAAPLPVAAKGAPDPSPELERILAELGRLRTERLIRMAEERYAQAKPKPKPEGGDA
jgi:hypothetical protein